MNKPAKKNATDDLITIGNQQTFDVFDVMVRERGKPEWKRVGLAYLDESGVESVVIRENAEASVRVFELRSIDRAQGRCGRTWTRGERRCTSSSRISEGVKSASA